MAESILPQQEHEKTKGEDMPSIKLSDSQTVPTQESSVVRRSSMNENLKVATSENAQGVLSRTFSRGLVFLKNKFFDELPLPLQERLSLLAKNFRKTGHQFFRLSAVRTYVRCMDDFVDASGSIVRRLQKVVATESLCLPTCPYLQHYADCPLSDKLQFSPILQTEESAEADAVKESSESLEKEGEVLKQESSSEAKQNSPAAQQELPDLAKDKPLTINTIVQEGYLERLFSFAFTWLVICPANTLVALLNFHRSLTHDLDEYFQAQSGYVTAVGRRVLSPRRVIRSKVVVRAKTLLKEVVNLSAGDRTTPFKLSLDPNLCILRAQPVYETRKTNLEKELSLEDLAESYISDDDIPDDDYVPSSPSQSSSADSNDCDDSITISENDLSVHEEDGFLALKDKVKDFKEEKLENPEKPIPVDS